MSWASAATLIVFMVCVTVVIVTLIRRGFRIKFKENDLSGTTTGDDSE